MAIRLTCEDCDFEEIITRESVGPSGRITRTVKSVARELRLDHGLQNHDHNVNQQKGQYDSWNQAFSPTNAN